MKLRNKKTGEIREIKEILIDGMFSVNSLAELNEEWEECEEPIQAYYIDFQGGIHCASAKDNNWSLERIIGNYFDTREEAEKALEKLKAWKRLKDKGFRFERWCIGGEYGNTITFSDYIEYNDKTRADLDLLFGGEE